MIIDVSEVKEFRHCKRKWQLSSRNSFHLTPCVTPPAFKMGTVKHIYFVAETKGSMDTLELRGIEDAKIHCAREHFKAISGEDVVYDVVDSYQALLDKVMK